MQNYSITDTMATVVEEVTVCGSLFTELISMRRNNGKE